MSNNYSYNLNIRFNDKSDDDIEYLEKLSFDSLYNYLLNIIEKFNMIFGNYDEEVLFEI